MPQDNRALEPYRSSIVLAPDDPNPMADIAPWQPLAPARRPIPWMHALLAVLGVMLIIGVVWAAQGFVPTWAPGTVERIAFGELYVLDSIEAPWLQADAGRIIRQGAYLHAEPGTIARLAFFGEAAVRLESGGDWAVRTLMASPNRRLSRLTVEQRQGRASYVSRPPRRGVRSRLSVRVPGARLDLTGVATLETDAAGHTTIQMLDGTAQLAAEDGQVTLVPGQVAYASPSGLVVRQLDEQEPMAESARGD